MPLSRVLALGHQASYRCRHSGACCTAGWRIPVEPERIPAIRAGFGDVLEPEHPILRTTSSGACVLFEPGRGAQPSHCAVHRACGHDALPSACRHFPRIYLHDAFATRVTLSHFCPTAASLALGDSELRVVEAPIELAPPGDREGLDARDALPPLLHPGMLMDVESYAVWESHAIELFAKASGPLAAIARLAVVTERIRQWQPRQIDPAHVQRAVTRASQQPPHVGQGFSPAHVGQGFSPAGGPLMDAVRVAFQEPPEPRFGSQAEARVEWQLNQPSSWRRHFDLACEAVPRGLTVRDMPAAWEETYARFVAPGWDVFSGALGRYLAGRLFGSWLAYHGRGLRTIVASLGCALSVVRIEAARECLLAGRILDAPLLTTALQQADLLLVHKADRQELATRLSHVEDFKDPYVGAGFNRPNGVG